MCDCKVFLTGVKGSTYQASVFNSGIGSLCSITGMLDIHLFKSAKAGAIAPVMNFFTRFAILVSRDENLPSR